MGINTEISEEIDRDRDECRSSVVEYVHDIIAAKFRFDHPEFEQLVIPEFEEISSDEERATALWLNFFDAELTRLYKFYPELIREILTAEFFPPPDQRGTASESWLLNYFNHEYYQLFLRKDVTIEENSKEL
jgi:hypothetical protein